MEEQTIYIGPNVLGLGLIRNQIFLGGVTGQVQAAMEKYPQIAELIVPVEDFSECEKKRDTKGEHLHRVYADFVQALGRDNVLGG